MKSTFRWYGDRDPTGILRITVRIYDAVQNIKSSAVPIIIFQGDSSYIQIKG